ncbi:TetR/AcrR family transcriptional regulator [Amycolatopsis sp.]|uniref:TetR/AcrR family transcriptional regulator n=1 Tax=Amycolatopsis sp. TaxID=37632 RepID=UPI002C5A1B76|nr:TetR/AcrR family transcriptional regulator C-terminal domain-containing protein [Amycolatopsis sp.]HVV07663.1 TetR/AcrR family transcriptional regulator C-terminal domain-containing protein [Amycolatopsis sp.]
MAARADSGRLVWERAEPVQRGGLSPLSRERVVAAAMSLADAEGLDAVSLRKVAAALDVGPMRLYGYVSTKDELLDLMVDSVYGEIPLPRKAGRQWQRTIRALARGLRKAARQHEWFADLLGGRPQLGPNALAYTESLLAGVRAAPGFEDIGAVLAAVGTVHSYVLGAIRVEITELRQERASGLDELRWQREVGPYLERMLATGRFPMLAEVVRDAVHPSRDTAFETGLGQVLRGISSTA